MAERYEVVRARTRQELYFSWDNELNFPTSPAVDRERAEKYCKEDQDKEFELVLA